MEKGLAEGGNLIGNTYTLGHLAYRNGRSKGCHVMRSVHLLYVFSLATPSICCSTSLFPAKKSTTTIATTTIDKQ